MRRLPSSMTSRKLSDEICPSTPDVEMRRKRSTLTLRKPGGKWPQNFDEIFIYAPKLARPGRLAAFQKGWWVAWRRPDIAKQRTKSVYWRRWRKARLIAYNPCATPCRAAPALWGSVGTIVAGGRLDRRTGIINKPRSRGRDEMKDKITKWSNQTGLWESMTRSSDTKNLGNWLFSRIVE